MATREMDLRLRILARGAEALRVLKDVERQIERMGKVAGAFRNAGAPVFRGLSTGAGLLLRPLKWAGAALLGLTATAAALGGKALFAAGNIESLRMRLDAVTASAEESKRIFAETIRMAVTSPYEPNELIDARISLINLGIKGQRAMQAVGDAAAVSGRQVQDVVGVLAGMESEPLRRMGIGLKTDNGSYEFQYRDRMQKVHKIVAQGVDAARTTLLKIFDIKYGGGMGKFTSTWAGLVSTLKGNVEAAFGSLGEGLLPAAKKFVDEIATRFDNWAASGKLAEAGKKAGEVFGASMLSVKTAFEQVQAIMESMKKQDAGVWAESLKVVLAAGGKILAVSFANYLAAMGSVFKGIAKVMSAALMEDIMNIPGLGGRIAEQGAYEVLRGRGLSYVQAMGGARGMSHEERVKTVMSTRSGVMEAGVNEFTSKLPGLAQETVGAVTEIIRETEARLQKLSGYTGPSYGERRDANKADAERTTDVVTGLAWRRHKIRDPMREGQYRYESQWDEVKATVPRGKYGRGVAPSGAIIVNINGDMVLKANDLKRMQQEIERSAATVAFAPAGS